MLREKVYKPILPLEPTSKTDAFAGCRVGSCSHGCVLLFCWFFFFFFFFFMETCLLNLQGIKS